MVGGTGWIPSMIRIHIRDPISIRIRINTECPINCVQSAYILPRTTVDTDSQRYDVIQQKKLCHSSK